jgi:predicted GNAT superfamily acetyltransferase
VIRLAALAEDRISAALELNNAHAVELSLQTEPSFRRLVRMACYARCTEAGEALLIAFDQDAPYGNENFAWWRSRAARFVYVDRVVVEPAHRRRGLARLLYEDLFGFARRMGHDRVVCEVNLSPPNPASDAFHRSLGFRFEGSANLTKAPKEVRYLCCALGRVSGDTTRSPTGT